MNKREFLDFVNEKRLLDMLKIEWTQEKSIKIQRELEKGWLRTLRQRVKVEGVDSHQILDITAPHLNDWVESNLKEELAIVRRVWHNFLESLGIRVEHDLFKSQTARRETDILEMDPSVNAQNSTMWQNTREISYLIIPKQTADKILVVGL